MKLKTIDIQAKEWFDKVNGNSYFSGTVTTNYGLDDEKHYYIPFQYGYGDHYKDVAFKLLSEKGLIPTDSYILDLKEMGVIVRSNIQRGCKKKELYLGVLNGGYDN